jgi:hypothetical protein
MRRKTMSKAEEAALNAYPHDYPERTGYREGYEEAERVTIERAIHLLKYADAGTLYINYFKRKMEEDDE